MRLLHVWLQAGTLFVVAGMAVVCPGFQVRSTGTAPQCCAVLLVEALHSLAAVLLQEGSHAVLSRAGSCSRLLAMEQQQKPPPEATARLGPPSR